MDSTYQLINTVSTIFIFLAAVPALWVSGRIILRAPIHKDRFTRLFLWLVLGGFFLSPLVDLFYFLRSLVSLVLLPDENRMTVVLFLGTTTWFLYSLFSLILTLIMYGIGIYLGRSLIFKDGLPMVEQLSLTDLEKTFLVLGLAGLLNAMVHSIILNFLWIGSTGASNAAEPGSGAIFGWILAVLILVAALLFMNGKLENET